MDSSLRLALLERNEELAKSMLTEELLNNMGISDLDEVWQLVCNFELVEVAKKLVEKILMNDGIKPLTYACKVKANKVAELLIERGAKINEKDIFGYTPLLCACKNSMSEVAKSLIQKGAYLDTRNKSANRPLIYACKNNKEIAKALIENEADVNAKDEFGNTPLIYACMNHNEKVVIMPIEKGAEVDVNFGGYALLVYASKKRNE